MKEDKGNVIRLGILAVCMTVIFGMLLYRFYDLQMLQGEAYQEAFVEQIERTRTTPGIRGNIYDRNGTLLAYNELVHHVVITDNGVYENQTQRNEQLNEILFRVLELLALEGTQPYTHLSMEVTEGELRYTVTGSRLQRFLADIYGHASIEDLTYNEELDYDESQASASQVLEYLSSDDMYGISVEYSLEQRLQIAGIRYAMSQNRYQRHLSTTIAESVSEEMVAAILENEASLPYIEITEETERRYNNSEYFAHILGYTGAISAEQLELLNEAGEAYEATDQIGIGGIEEAMEQSLRGSSGVERFYVDSLGRELEMLETTEATSGQDVYLTLDAELQMAVYELLEQELAGILLNNMSGTASSSSGNIVITAKDVYKALIDNHVILLERLAEGSAGTELQTLFQMRLEQVQASLETVMQQPYGQLSAEDQEYLDFALTFLQEEEIYLPTAVDRSREEYLEWREGTLSCSEYLAWLTGQEAIDVTQIGSEEEYLAVDQVVAELMEYLTEQMQEAAAFHQLIYDHLIEDNTVSGDLLCRVLMEQGELPWVEEDYQGLESGRIAAFSYLQTQIRNLEITPAQLALDPCTASSVIVDVETGEVLASVSYPGYDNNRLANQVDGTYYNSLLADASMPLYNNATQQQTAPGSTLKPLIAAASLSEGLIAPTTEIIDGGIFTEIDPNPRCWIYPGGTHGSINVSEAIRDSCNFFFYTMGYRMSQVNGTYQDAAGIQIIQQYAELFGLDERTGIEITESAPHVADQYPVTAAIGQSNHNYTTTQLARYTAALASRGQLYHMSLVKGTAEAGGAIPQGSQAYVERSVDQITDSTWDAVALGMQMMGEGNRTLSALGMEIAGKTGTAQQISTRPNHALFIGYAPYDQPEIAIATRIAYGYSSANAVEASANILKYYFGLEEEEELLTGQAQENAHNGNVVLD